MRVSELPKEERPREKLLARGAGALTDAELLAVLLRTGRPGEGVLELARAWLESAGSLAALATADVGDIVRRPGVGPAKGTIVAAALELGRRLAAERVSGQPLLDRPEAVADLLRLRWSEETVEVFGCLTLDVRHRLRREHVLHRGARTHADVEPAELFRTAIADNAHAVVLWHNHPSGDPVPSADDVDLTRRLAEAGRLLNVPVLDHLVVARGGFVSFRRRGLLPLA